MKPNQNTTVAVIELEMRKWLCKVGKVKLLNLLWVPHFHRALITFFFIRQLLCVVHNGCLWLEEPIPITTYLIHHISGLPCKREDLADI